MKETINTRFIKLLNKSSLSSTEFGEKIGATKQQISNWKANYSIPIKQVSAILELFPELDARWLLLGEGDMYGNSCPNCKQKDDIIKDMAQQIDSLGNEVEKREHTIEIIDQRRIDFIQLANEIKSLRSELIMNNYVTKKNS